MPGRFALKDSIKNLYGARSKAAHGSQHDPLTALRETEKLFRRILLKIIDEGTIPTKGTLEDALFSH